MKGRRAICNTTLNLPLANLLGVGPSAAEGIIWPAFDAAVARGATCVIMHHRGERTTRILQAIARQRGRDATVLALRDPKRSVGWNPLKEVGTMARARNAALCLVQSAYRDSSALNADRSSENLATDWITDALHAISTDSPPKDRHFGHLRNVVVRGAFRAFAQAHPNYAALARLQRLDDGLSSNLHAASSAISERLVFADDERVAAVLANDELRLGRFVANAGILIVETDEIGHDALRPLTALFMRQLFSALLGRADSSLGEGGPQRCFIFVEELAAIGRIPGLSDMLYASSDCNVSVIGATRSLRHVLDLYRGDTAPILGEFPSQIAFPGGVDPLDAEYFSERSGSTTVKTFVHQETYDEFVDVHLRNEVHCCDRVVTRGVGAEQPSFSFQTFP